MYQQPVWETPSDIQQHLEADEDGVWEDERWEPILLTAMTGTSHEGRDIPIMWQIEFEPPDDRDGDEWDEILRAAFVARHPGLAGEVHSDSESSTCVLWVESEQTCQKLLEVAWRLVMESMNGPI